MVMRSDVLFLHIFQAHATIVEYVQGMRKADFLKDQKTQDAVIRQLEIIGEAVKHLPETTKKEASHIAWRQIAGMRDVLIHEYFGVDLEIIWKVVKQDLPKFIRAVRTLVKDASV